MLINATGLKLSQQIFAGMLDENADAPLFTSMLKESLSIDGKLAAEIYRNNSIGTRTKTLQEIYPVVEKILGDKCFNRLAYDFVTTTPSNNSDLNAYGENFPDFLSAIVVQQDAFKTYSYLSELACLEWHFHAAYYADDDPFFSASESTPIDTSVLVLQSQSLYTISTAFPVFAIWHGNQGDEGVTEVTSVDGNEYILISRHQGHPRIEKICSEDWRIIQWVEDGIELEALAAKAVEQGLELQARLPAMIELGWLVLYQDS